jgi:LPXTG-motif cell wall-anchored protein/uncharacterized repeat protein (TIGR01451 family)
MNRKLYKLNMVLFTFVIAFFLAVLAIPAAHAEDCEPNYGGGETCEKEEDLEISKQVRKYKDSLGDDEGFKDKVTGIEKGDIIEFKITVKNDGDDAEDIDVKDYLPEELKKITGDTSKHYDKLEAGEKKTFRIRVRVYDSEFDRDDNFEKCVVNKVTLKQDDDKKASDTATVCYGDSEIEELPETGSIAAIFAGLGSAISGLGLYLKKRN